MNFEKRITAIAPLLTLLALPLAPARAQDAPAASAPAKSGVATAREGRRETLKQVAARLSETTGLRVLADSAVARQLLVAPEDASVTPETLEDYLTRLTRRLTTGGAVWHKVYLPATADGQRPFTADAVAQFALAQKALLGRSAPNMVEIQGKVLSPADAASVIQSLGLKPVYVVTNRQVATATTMMNAMSAAGATSQALTDALKKQLGVTKATDIPPGSYKISLPGPDGALINADIEVSDNNGQRRMEIRMGSGAGSGSGGGQ